MEKVKDLKLEIKSIREAQQKNRDEVHALKIKQKDLQERMPSLKGDVTRAEEKKHKMLQQYASDKASEAEVQNARETVDETKKKVSNADELIDAMDNGMAALEEEYQRLQKDHADAVKNLWLTAYEEIKAELTGKGFREKVRRAYVMKSRGIGGGHFNIIVADLFGGSPESDELTTINKTLEEELFGESLE